MILQMRDIELNAEYAEYRGELWHVQGQCNKRICAIGCYIYSTSNLSAGNDWWAEVLRGKCVRLVRLPLGLWARIVEIVDGWLVGWEEGEKMREPFLEERNFFRER